MNMPCRSCVEASLPASEKLETTMAPHNCIDDATAFEKTRACSKRTYSSFLCSDPELLWASSCLSESTRDRSDAAAERASNADS
jgi:hypothetical protein